ncbi:MAG: biopolymer transporter ExbD [Terracidiphilus sp.]|jgi:biopolymer transport protein ExbD
MNVRCSTTSISALVLSLCLVTSIPVALSNASTWNELTIKLPFGSMWNFLAPLGFAYLGIVAIGLIVLWTGYRKRERWAWFVILIALLFFYFPSYVLPVVLQSRRFGWPHLLDFLGIFRVGGWWHCWIASLRPNYIGGLACVPFEILIRPLEFFVMSIALLLPVKAFFLKPVPHQPGTRTKIAALLGKRTWVWVIALLLAIAIAVAFTVRSCVASSQNSVTENLQSKVMPFTPHPMVAVTLAKAENAVAMPDAGQEDAIVVAVVRDGAVFLGQEKVDPSQLGSRIRDKLAGKTDETIYLRADARANYRDVEDVIDAIRSAGAEEFGLLTQRKEEAQPEDYLWIGNPLLKSVGLEVFIPSSPKTPRRGSSPPDNTIVVHVVYRPNAAPAYTINAADVTHTELQSKLTEIYSSRSDRVMFVTGDDNLRFSDIADVIDIGRASNVDHIGLMTPGIITGN